MKRLLSAAAVAALVAFPAFASPAFAQSASGTGGSGGTSGYGSSPGSGGTGIQQQMQQAPGTSSNIPADCTANDSRPECQTAQLPGNMGSQQQQPGSSAINPNAVPPEQVPGSLGSPSKPSGD
jgi:hypothetical protein